MNREVRSAGLRPGPKATSSMPGPPARRAACAVSEGEAVEFQMGGQNPGDQPQDFLGGIAGIAGQTPCARDHFGARLGYVPKRGDERRIEDALVGPLGAVASAA